MIIKTTLEKNGFLGTFYEGSTYADKAVIYVGGTGENRSTVEERASKLCRREGFSVLALPREDKQDRHDGQFPWGSIYAALLLAHWRHNLRHTRFGL